MVRRRVSAVLHLFKEKKMPSTATQISKALYDLNCIMEGSYFFALENGRLTTTFVDPKAIYTKPDLVEMVAEELLKCFSQRLRPDVEVIATPSTLVTPLAHAVARQFKNFHLKTPDVVYVRPHSDTYVLEKRFESLVANRPVLIVEDVVFTGRPLLHAARCISRVGGKVVGSAALIRYSGIEIEDVQMPVFPTLPEFPTFIKGEHTEWGTWPIATDFGYPDKVPDYFGPKRTFFP
ncbi:MAG: hypothetical protein RLZZ480_250 [Candidatus Parcubacteria bacterium]|jgi:orotate phosphoribosyltransferase